MIPCLILIPFFSNAQDTNKNFIQSSFEKHHSLLQKRKEAKHKHKITFLKAYIKNKKKKTLLKKAFLETQKPLLKNTAQYLLKKFLEKPKTKSFLKEKFLKKKKTHYKIPIENQLYFLKK